MNVETEKTKEEAKKLLEEGLRKIRTKGWCQNVFSNKEGNLCMAGAIRPFPSTEVAAQALRTMEEVIREVTPDFPFGISAWNDVPERTQQEVENVFEKAIAKLC